MKTKLSVAERYSEFLLSVFALLLVFITENHAFISLIILIYTIVIAWLNSKHSILDPRVLLLMMFAVYSVWFSLHYALVDTFGLIHVDRKVLTESLRLQFFAMFVSVLVSSTIIKNNRAQMRDRFFTKLKSKQGALLSENVIFWLALIYVSFALLSIALGGYSSKRDILDSASAHNTLAQLTFYFLVVILIFKVLKGGKIANDYQVFVVISTAFLFLAIIGERDIFFRVVVILLILMIEMRRYPVFTWAMIIVVSATVLLPISQGFKAIFLSGEINITKAGYELIFSNEFVSAGRNLYALMYFGVTESYSFLLNDVLRAFLPSVLMPSTNVMSATAWFNSVYRVENSFSGTSGWGFTLVGEGYLAGGYVGVFLVMFFYSAILSYFYNMRFKSKYFYAFYILALVNSIYIARADLANFLSQIFKIGGMSVLLLFLFHRLFVALKREG